MLKGNKDTYRYSVPHCVYIIMAIPFTLCTYLKFYSFTPYMSHDYIIVLYLNLRFGKNKYLMYKCVKTSTSQFFHKINDIYRPENG